MCSVHPEEEIMVSSGAPSSRWITFKACDVLLIFAASHLMFWELPGHDVCTTADISHPHSPPHESEKSEGLCVLPVLGQSCLLLPSCYEKYHISDSFLGGKIQTDTGPSFCLMCLLLFSIRVPLQNTLREKPNDMKSVNHSHGFCDCRGMDIRVYVVCACVLSCVSMHICKHAS